MNDYFLYKGNRTNQISFPLGGLGTGCIGLAGNGRLIDWEIFNRPNKGSVNGFSHFAIKAETNEKVLDARILQGDLQGPYHGDFHAPHFQSFGFGPRREYLTGMPHFDEVDFRGEFPFADLDYISEQFPGKVRLKAFNPFIPLNDKDSGIPAAFFEFEICNTSTETLTYSLAGVLANPFPENVLNTIQQEGRDHLLTMTTEGLSSDDPAYGCLTLATDASDVSWQHYWFRGEWFDSLEVYWRDLNSLGKFKDRNYEGKGTREGVVTYRGSNEGLLAAHLKLAPGETGTVRFIMSWNFPTCENYWNEAAQKAAREADLKPTWKNYYATLWEDSKASASYALTNWDRLYGETKTFKDALFSSTVPVTALDAISANISILKTPTAMRLEDGTFYGWEGLHVDAGCCEGTCTHVWNYAQALPFLFPKLERSIRDSDYKYNLRADGGMTFRMMLPLGTPSERTGVVQRPCADGQFGGVMKTYRDWKISGDYTWLKSLWPALKASIEFAWHPDNEDKWDPDKTGVLWGRQHHTLDMELFEPNAWLTGFYLGALKAGAEIAEYLGESETTTEYLAIFNKGKTWTDEHLFNGEYYQQQIDLKDKSLLETFDSGSIAHSGGSAVTAYWNGEHSEMKYQIAEGCVIDQLLAQWHANLYGLGELFDPNQGKSAVNSIYKYNFKTSSRETYNPCRIYSLNDEAGLIICTWPEGRYQPMIPLTYAQETMHGYEYAAASLMLQNGLIEEGETVVASVRKRYDGERRNPWNEIECGSNYARSMASYSLLLDYSGFSFDMPKRQVGFSPIQGNNNFSCFWSLETAWGSFETKGNTSKIKVLYGQLELDSLALPYANSITSAELGTHEATFSFDEGVVRFKKTALIHPDESLTLNH